MSLYRSWLLLLDMLDFQSFAVFGLEQPFGRQPANDTVAFSYEPGKGVNITINDVFLGNIAGDKFFNMLLRTWVGRVPLSSDYKDDILKNGKVSADLKSRFDKIKPSKMPFKAI